MLTAAGVAARTKRMRATAGTGSSVARKKLGITPEKETQIRNRTCSAPWADVQFRDEQDIGPDGQIIPYRLHNARLYPPAGSASRMCRCLGCLSQRHHDDHADEIAPPTPPGITGKAICVDHDSYMVQYDSDEDVYLLVDRIANEAGRNRATNPTPYCGIVRLYDRLDEAQQRADRLNKVTDVPRHRAHGSSPSAKMIQRAQEMNVRLETIKILPESNSDLRQEIKRWGKFKPR